MKMTRSLNPPVFTGICDPSIVLYLLEAKNPCFVRKNCSKSSKEFFKRSDILKICINITIKKMLLEYFEIILEIFQK